MRPTHLLTLPLSLMALCVIPATPALAVEPACPNETVRQQSNINPGTGRPYSTELPECRSYEKVTSGKNGADAMLSPLLTRYHSGFGGFGLIADGGIVWEAPATWPYGEPSNGQDDVRRAARTPAGWSQTTIAPASSSASKGFILRAASSDLNAVVLQTEPGEHVLGEEDMSLMLANGDSCCTTMASGLTNPTYNASQRLSAQVSADGDHVFFQTEATALEDQTPSTAEPRHEIGSRQVYEWTAAGGPRLAAVDSEGNPTSLCGAALAGEAAHATDISPDGSRVLFLSPDPSPGYPLDPEGAPAACKLGPPGDEYVSNLYLRKGGRTLNISEPPSGQADYGARFVGMTPSASRVFFISESSLTPDKVHSGSGYADLYEYDLETNTRRRLSVGAEEAGVQEAIPSADGTHVYFTALGALVPGAVGEKTRGEDRTLGSVNLYIYFRGAVTFIANLRPAAQSVASGQYGAEGPPLEWLHSAVTPSGADIVFESDSRLTAYDNEGHAELYRYDMISNTISCVSCSPVGLPPNDEHGPVFRTSFQQEPQGTAEQFGGLSEDGSTVFFASTNRLLPAAVNATAPEVENPIYDIYEWHEGVLSLISTGTSTSSDFLLGASPSGSDVYFLTASQLVPQDGDHAADIYDARVGGGFAPPSVTPPCESLAMCRSMPATPPTTVTPATIAVKSEGNAAIVEPMPAKGKAVKPKSKAKPSCQAKAKRIKSKKKRNQALRKCTKPKKKGKAKAKK